MYSAVGGWANATGEDGSAKANNNVVTVDGGILNSGVFGGYASASDINNAQVSDNKVQLGGNVVVKGDVYGGYILIDADDEIKIDSSNIHSNGFTAGVAVEGDGEAVMEDGNLIYKITGLHTARQTKLVAENRAVAAAFVNQGTDLISDSLDALNRDGSLVYNGGGVAARY